MKVLAMPNVLREITPITVKTDLQFLLSKCPFIVLFACVKFCVNISNGTGEME